MVVVQLKNNSILIYSSIYYKIKLMKSVEFLRYRRHVGAGCCNYVYANERLRFEVDVKLVNLLQISLFKKRKAYTHGPCCYEHKLYAATFSRDSELSEQWLLCHRKL